MTLIQLFPKPIASVILTIVHIGVFEMHRVIMVLGYGASLNLPLNDDRTGAISLIFLHTHTTTCVAVSCLIISCSS